MIGSWVYVTTPVPGRKHEFVSILSDFTVQRAECSCGSIYAGNDTDDLSKVLEQHKGEAEQ